MANDHPPPQLKDQGKLQNSFDITLGEWRNSWYHFKLPSCHFTPIFKNCANCSLHIFRIWFLWLLFSINPISFVIGIKNLCFLLHFSYVLIRFFKNKWTLKNWLKSHRFDVQSSILLKAFCHALLSFYTWKKKYLTMWFWTLNLRSRILGYQVKKKLLIE